MIITIVKSKELKKNKISGGSLSLEAFFQEINTYPCHLLEENLQFLFRRPREKTSNA